MVLQPDGSQNIGFCDEIHQYDIEGEEWTLLGQTQTPMGAHCSAIFQSTNSLFVYGGTNGARFFDSILKMNLETKEWTMLRSFDGDETGNREFFQSPRIASMMAQADEEVLVLFGGSGYEKDFNDVLVIKGEDLKQESNYATVTEIM